VMHRHYNIEISGKVHGVFFRASAKKQADLLDIKGFVRNEPTGKVYIEAEADEVSLDKFVEWCRQGPTQAKVENLKLTEGDMQHFQSFELMR
jgi:acylphosphatase